MAQTPFHALKRLAALGALVAAATSCGDVVRSSSAPVLLVINQLEASPGGGHGAGQFSGFLLSDVQVLLTSPAPCTPAAPCPTIYDDTGQALLSLAPKDIGTATTPTTPSTNNQVTINRVHVKYVRADGLNTQGVDVPYEFDGAATGTVPQNGQATLVFELVRHEAKSEPPLLALVYDGQIITTIAQVTFYGTDLVGNAISVTGNIQVNFGNFGDQ
jgi:hypothetical protein